MDNNQFASVLEALAKKYRENEKLPQLTLLAWRNSKTELVNALRGFGGKWSKFIPKGEDGYSIVLSSVDFAPLQLYIPRDRVCHKIVRFECDPLLSPEDEAEVLVAASGDAA